MKNIISKLSIVSLAIATFGLGACASKKDPKIDDWSHNSGLPIGHGQSNETLPPPPPIAPQAPLPPLAPPQMAYANSNTTTYLAGCTGEYFVADFNSGKILSSGRAFNATDGLYVLDAKGSKTGKVLNADSSKSVFFRPDCNCKPSGFNSAAPMPQHKNCPVN